MNIALEEKSEKYYDKTSPVLMLMSGLVMMMKTDAMNAECSENQCYWLLYAVCCI